MVKKLCIIIVCITVFIIGAGVVSFSLQPHVQPTSAPIIEQKHPQVTLVIDDGVTIATYSAQAATAFEALLVVGSAQGFSLQTKQYDFGVFVEAIGDRKSTKDQSWIYFVNGASGTVAADKNELHPGDLVEWKYLQPKESL